MLSIGEFNPVEDFDLLRARLVGLVVDAVVQETMRLFLENPLVLGSEVCPYLWHFPRRCELLFIMVSSADDGLRGAALVAVLGRLADQPLIGAADHRLGDFSHDPNFGTRFVLSVGFHDPGVESDPVFRAKEIRVIFASYRTLFGELFFWSRTLERLVP